MQEDAELPVTSISWEDATDFCHWLSAECGRAFRLPTEAEWEYCCRAGTTTAFSTGREITVADANYLYNENGQRIGIGGLTGAGSYPPNQFGLEDLHGNVCEWVVDAWHPNYNGVPCDGSAWQDGGVPEFRVIRGGAWDYLPRLLRSSWRDSLHQSAQRDNVGFRIAVTLEN
jgi:formylglycine-generating enzyme required for sulfatase activity